MGKREDIKIWKCESCQEFHIKAGSVLLTFTSHEFAEFVNETWNCFYEKEFELAFVN